jgi:hypothetical protein
MSFQVGRKLPPFAFQVRTAGPLSRVSVLSLHPVRLIPSLGQDGLDGDLSFGSGRSWVRHGSIFFVSYYFTGMLVD